MAISTLPNGNSTTLDVVPATKEEMMQMSQQNGTSWRGALSIEGYLRREECLAQTRLCQNGGLTGWILIDTSRKDRFALAGCETIRKRAFVSANGEVKEVICHGIGSVFCPVECRKRGYGGRLMRELRTKLETWQTDEKESAFSILYSDIGKQFYSAYGWQTYASAHIRIRASKPSPENDPQQDSITAIHPLFSGDLASLCVQDEIMLRQKLETYRDRTAIAIIPDLKTMEWHHAREDFVSQELYGKKPYIKGAMITDKEGSCRAWCVWTRMWYNEDRKSADGNTMHILRLVVEDDNNADSSFEPRAKKNGLKTLNNGINDSLKFSLGRQSRDDMHVSAIQALLLVARQEAYRWKCATIDAWNPSASLIRAAQGLDPNVKLEHREVESIPSLRFHGSGSEKVEWVCNEKYAWC